MALERRVAAPDDTFPMQHGELEGSRGEAPRTWPWGFPRPAEAGLKPSDQHQGPKGGVDECRVTATPIMSLRATPWAPRLGRGRCDIEPPPRPTPEGRQ